VKIPAYSCLSLKWIFVFPIQPGLYYGNHDTFYGTREEHHAPEECGKSPEAASLDSAPSACVSAWEYMADKRSTVPVRFGGEVGVSVDTSIFT
jgi:hypothetical protein